jgi:hypothetical protein
MHDRREVMNHSTKQVQLTLMLKGSDSSKCKKMHDQNKEILHKGITFLALSTMTIVMFEQQHISNSNNAAM